MRLFRESELEKIKGGIKVKFRSDDKELLMDDGRSRSRYEFEFDPSLRIFANPARTSKVALKREDPPPQPRLASVQQRPVGTERISDPRSQSQPVSSIVDQAFQPPPQQQQRSVQAQVPHTTKEILGRGKRTENEWDRGRRPENDLNRGGRTENEFDSYNHPQQRSQNYPQQQEQLQPSSYGERPPSNRYGQGGADRPPFSSGNANQQRGYSNSAYPERQGYSNSACPERQQHGSRYQSQNQSQNQNYHKPGNQNPNPNDRPRGGDFGGQSRQYDSPRRFDGYNNQNHHHNNSKPPAARGYFGRSSLLYTPVGRSSSIYETGLVEEGRVARRSEPVADIYGQGVSATNKSTTMTRRREEYDGSSNGERGPDGLTEEDRDMLRKALKYNKKGYDIPLFTVRSPKEDVAFAVHRVEMEINQDEFVKREKSKYVTVATVAEFACCCLFQAPEAGLEVRRKMERFLDDKTFELEKHFFQSGQPPPSYSHKHFMVGAIIAIMHGVMSGLDKRRQDAHLRPSRTGSAQAARFGNTRAPPPGSAAGTTRSADTGAAPRSPMDDVEDSLGGKAGGGGGLLGQLLAFARSLPIFGNKTAGPQQQIQPGDEEYDIQPVVTPPGPSSSPYNNPYATPYGPSPPPPQHNMFPPQYGADWWSMPPMSPAGQTSFVPPFPGDQGFETAGWSFAPPPFPYQPTPVSPQSAQSPPTAVPTTRLTPPAKSVAAAAAASSSIPARASGAGTGQTTKPPSPTALVTKPALNSSPGSGANKPATTPQTTTIKRPEYPPAAAAAVAVKQQSQPQQQQQLQPVVRRSHLPPPPKVGLASEVVDAVRVRDASSLAGSTTGGLPDL